MIWIGDTDHGRQIAHAAGVGWDGDLDVCFSRVTSEGNLMGGFVFNSYTRAAISIHMAGWCKNWCTAELLWVVHHYAFEQLSVRRVFAPVVSTNTAAKRTIERGGYKLHASIKDAVENGDLLVYRMTKEGCRWLGFTDRFMRREAA